MSLKNRESTFKLIIILFWIILFFATVFILVWTGTIHFSWSDKILEKQKYEQNKTKNKKILVIGDSQLERWPIDHCLSKDIEQFCVENNVGCVNASHYGFGPIEYKDQLLKLGPDYQPGLILIFYYTGNDIAGVVFRDNQTPTQPSHEFSQIKIGQKQVKDSVDMNVFVDRSAGKELIAGKEKNREIKGFNIRLGQV